jgi:site-specific DNA recombinase
MDLKRNALQKFIGGDISKEDYHDFVSMIQDKLQQLEIEKSTIKKRWLIASSPPTYQPSESN